MGDFDADIALFADFVAHLEAAKQYQNWRRDNCGKSMGGTPSNPAPGTDVALWDAFKNDLLAGKTPVPPDLKTAIGDAFVEAGKEHMSITHLIGMMQNPYPTTPPTAPGPPPAPETWSGPITIVSGGTYTGAWESTTSQPAITIATTEPVIIENSFVRNLSSDGYIIDAYHSIPGAGIDVTIRNCFITGADQWDSPRWFVAREWKNLVIQNCTIVNTRGIELWATHQPNPTTIIEKCRHTNIKGTTNGGDLNQVGNFVQFRVIWGGPSDAPINPTPGVIYVRWNEIINEPEKGNAEDLISVFKTAHLRISDNMFWHHSKPSVFAGSSQNGITIDSSGEPTTTNDNMVERCQVVAGHGIAHFGGNNNLFLDNHVIASNSQGTRGMKLQPGFVGCHAHGNLLGFDGAFGRIDGDLSGAVEGDGNGVDTGEWANNTHYPPFPGDVPASAETDEWTFWQQKLSTNGISIGASSSGTPAPPPTAFLFQDEFDGPAGSAPDTSKWWATPWCSTAADDAEGCYNADNAYLDGNGNLVLKVSAGTMGRTYDFARIQTFTEDGWPPGTVLNQLDPPVRVEARIKFAGGAGIWGAFWLMANRDTPNNLEIDVQEFRGAHPTEVAVHTHITTEFGPAAYDTGVDLTADFHIYWIEYHADRVVFGIDDTEITSTNLAVAPPEMIRLNNVVGVPGTWGGEGGPPPASKIPSLMLVDYVRAWRI